MVGQQRPKYASIPPAVGSSGEEAIALCRIAGLNLDEWQEYVLVQSLGERPDGKWSAFEVGLAIPRQNGKTELLVARQLVGLFLLHEPLQIHSAHQFSTAMECFRRLVFIIENTPELLRLVKLSRGKVGKEGNGKEGIEMLDGCRIQYKARSGGGGRGFTCDCLYLDEAMILKESFIGSVLPTLSAVPNPQVWYAGSAVDETVHDDGIVFARVRERGLAQEPDLCWLEWSVDADEYLQRPEIASDPAYWGQANPAMGLRITEDYIAKEKRAMSEESFIVERLGIGNWPRTDGKAHHVIDPDDWRACLDALASPQGQLTLAIDVSPTRSHASVAVAGAYEAQTAVEVIACREGATWLVEAVTTLLANHPGAKVMADGAGGAASLIPELERAGVKVQTVSGREMATACGHLHDLITDHKLVHRPDRALDAALDGAITRDLEGAWAWSKRSSRVDITPLVAVTLAAWGASTATSQVTYREIPLHPELPARAPSVTNEFYSVTPMR